MTTDTKVAAQRRPLKRKPRTGRRLYSKLGSCRLSAGWRPLASVQSRMKNNLAATADEILKLSVH